MRFLISSRRRTDGAHGEAQVLVDRFLLDQAEVLEDHPHRPAQIGNLPTADGLQMELIDEDVPFRGLDLAGNELDDGGLAGTGLAHQP